ncbi:MAG: glycosyltransferase family 39 protein [Planctomycetota bacterium]|nr:glycosyltransferase family 39 protein [Planctomycetota bacterium]
MAHPEPDLQPRPSGLVPATAQPRDGRVRLLLFLVLAVALALRLLSIGDPWSGLAQDFHNHFGAFATGGQAARFHHDGFGELHYLLTSWRVVFEDGTAVSQVYSHHPPLFIYLEALALDLFGVHEWALRLVPLCFSMLSVLGAFRLGRLVWGARAGLLMAAVLAVVPWSAWYGVQTFTEGTLIWIACEEVRRYVLWLRTGERSHLWIAALWQLLAGLMDWPGGFLLLGLGFHGLLVATRTRGWRGLLSLLVLPGAFLLAALAHWVHLGLVMGEAGRGEDTAATIATVTTLTTSLEHFLVLQGRFLWRFLGAGFCVLFVLGGVRALGLGLRRRLSAEDWLWPALLVPGILYVVLFPQRSVNHDFFFMLALPGVAVLSSGLLLGVLDRLRARLGAGRGGALGGLLVVLLLGSAAWRTVEVWQARRSVQLVGLVESEWLAPELADPRGVILTHFGRGMSLPFYSTAQLIHSVDDRARFEAIEARVLDRLKPGRPAWFLFDLASAEKLDSGPASELLDAAGLLATGGEQRARAIEQLLASLPADARDSLMAALLTPELAALHAAVTAQHPSTLHVVEGTGLFELVDLSK